MLLKEYKIYEYLKVLNRALEITDIRFYERDVFHSVDP
jgi:hypothetical protein